MLYLLRFTVFNFLLYTIYIVSICFFLISCQNKDVKKSVQLNTNNDNSRISNPKESIKTITDDFEEKEVIAEEQTAAIKETTEEDIITTISGDTSAYNWLEKYSLQSSIKNQIAVPAGYKRIKAMRGSFTEWLRGLPLNPENSKVMLYNGEVKPYQEGAFRVINIDIGPRDLQQCADAVMRLKAEYHYSNKSYGDIHFNYTSGHKVAFSDWASGKKPKIKNSKVYFTSPSGSRDYSYSNFRKYMKSIFNYAGTASLTKELKTKAIKEIEAGDVFIWGGFPGHAIIVVDVAEHRETGKKIFMVAQSYMPAQSIHILRNFNNHNLSPWYSEDFGSQLETPEWTFERNSLKTFEN